MWPLLKRDGLGVQYVALLILWNRLVGYNPLKFKGRSLLQLLSTVHSLTHRCCGHRSDHVILGGIRCLLRITPCRGPVHASRPPPRPLPRAQRARQHPRLRSRLALEHQARCRGQLGAWRSRIALEQQRNAGCVGEETPPLPVRQPLRLGRAQRRNARRRGVFNIHARTRIPYDEPGFRGGPQEEGQERECRHSLNLAYHMLYADLWTNFGFTGVPSK